MGAVYKRQAYSICAGLPPNNWLAAADAMEHATPTSAWNPASAPEMEALVFTMFPISPAVARARSCLLYTSWNDIFSMVE